MVFVQLAARGLVVEVSFERLYQGQPLFDEIYDTMREAGFTYRGATGQLLSPIDGAEARGRLRN